MRYDVKLRIAGAAPKIVANGETVMIESGSGYAERYPISICGMDSLIINLYGEIIWGNRLKIQVENNVKCDTMAKAARTFLLKNFTTGEGIHERK